MEKFIIHLADLHFREGWTEEQGVVLNSFFDDLTKQIEQIDNTNIYLAFSGDIVQAGGKPELYDAFISKFDEKLNEIGILKDNRICVPGNHDISVDCVESRIVDHDGVISLQLDETSFNEYFEKPSSIFVDKFRNYNMFESNFASLNTTQSKITGAGWEIDENIGVYCLNTALFSSGGLHGKIDTKKLSVNTINLHLWNSKCKCRWKILIMHHPLNWLIDWAEKELRILLKNDFSLCLTGHNHEQSALHSICKDTSLTECSAPPLFTRKKDQLGYSIISISPDVGVTAIKYRQWTGNHSWVSGVNFSNTDDGIVNIANGTIKNPMQSSHHAAPKTDHDFVNRFFLEKLKESLITYSSQPTVWVDPILCEQPERSGFDQPVKKISFHDLLLNPQNTIVKAPPQFGLTCLARKLVCEAWRSKENHLWLYLDSKKLKPHVKPIEKIIKDKLQLISQEQKDIHCVILDSWQVELKDAVKLLEAICKIFIDIPVIVMQTVVNADFFNTPPIDPTIRKFDALYLWSLTRGHVRKVINEYNEKRPIGDEDKIINRVVLDLEVLNLHRTPLNCLTLLKVSEIDFDESPVNRTEMIKRVLFLIFNVDEIPTYKARPDLKDCEYVLGYFCEIMLKKGDFIFTMDYFIHEISQFCKQRVIDLEVQVVFDVLFYNNILIRDGNLFCFRFSYWVYYFLAQRMHHESDFAKYIFEDMRYANFPEVIEFYTGIDRRREDALEYLNRDLEKFYLQTQKKSGLPEDLNPYNIAYWTLSERALEELEEEVRTGVLNSNLPDSIKDEYADRQYNPSKPYCQDISHIIDDYSFGAMMQALRAGSRALRNSDYTDPTIKVKMLENLLACWNQIVNVLLILTPLLASKGRACYDGAGVYVLGDFGSTLQERLDSIFIELPNNVISWYQFDIFSQKMGPLLIKQIQNEKNEIKKHLLILLLIKQRPRKWKEYVEKYIFEIKKNSFYLLDVHRILCSQYKYSYASSSTLSDIKHLIKMTISKHDYGTKKPSLKHVNKIKDNGLPERKVE